LSNVGLADVQLAKSLGAMDLYAVGKEQHHPPCLKISVPFHCAGISNSGHPE
jgi:NADPH:quinone reductase-like Zn-dependent oxidoreductase